MSKAVSQIIENMRQNEAVVRVQHQRPSDSEGNVSACGGQTVVTLEDSMGDGAIRCATGMAECSEQDNFCKREGVAIAFRRMMEDARNFWTREELINLTRG